MTTDERQARGVEFVAPGEVTVRDFETDSPGPGEVVVDASLSVVSSGTERLVYNGEVPEEKAEVPGVGELSYPTRYGYSVVGEVDDTGSDVEGVKIGDRVHVMHPHQSVFTASAREVRQIPDGVTDEQAVHLPNTETAVSFAMDGSPVVGERVAVFGQGVVGLLTAGVLSSYPVEVVTFDPIEGRRIISEEVGADASHQPDSLEAVEPENGYDLVYEVSGEVSALDRAISAAGQGGRVVVGSWYGTRSASVNLGESFHGEGITISDSQVSEISPVFRERWTKDRRIRVAWRFLEDLAGPHLITDRFSIKDADSAYEAVNSGELCVVFEY